MMCLGFIPVKAESTDVSTIDNVVYLNPVTANAGTQCVLSIQMKNVDAITGYEFFLELPAGLTFAKDEDDFLLAALSEARTTSKKTNYFDCTVTDDGLLHVLCSTTAADATNSLYTFSGTDGEVCTVAIDVPADFEAGTYPIVLKNIVLTPSAADKGYETERVETILTIEGVDDGRLKFDETSTSLPTYTAGTKADVTVKRTIKAGEWSSLVLPFNLTKANATAVFGSDVQFAKFAGFEVDYGDDDENVVPLGITINLTEYTIPARGNMAGGTPVLIKTSQDIEEFQLDGVTLTTGVTEVENADKYETPGLFTGTLVKSTIPSNGLFISDNKFWYSTGKTNVKAFRCWFELGAVLDKETDFGARVMLHFIDDEATGISQIENRKSVNSKCYDLLGRRMASSMFNSQSSILKKGIYVKEGKKVVIK